MPTPYTRREFLRTSGRGVGLLAFSQYAPFFLAQSTLAKVPAAERDRSILVLIQLAGGNDGLNTIVPYQNDHYYNLRPTLGLPREELITVNDKVAFPRAFEPLYRLFQEGELSIVQNVGYPNPNRSHFRSMEIWETAAQADENLPTGWLGRYLDNQCAGVDGDGADPAAAHFSPETPLTFHAEQPHAVHGVNLRRGGGRGPDASLALLEDLLAKPLRSTNANASFLQHTMLNALAADRKIEALMQRYRPGVTYPQSALGQNLRGIAALIAGGLDTRVYFATLGGFDTHSNQAGQHARLLGTLAEALAAFQTDLAAHGLDDQVLTMTFSEFGRRANENGSRGTDHGAAAPLFVMGRQCQGTIIGEEPLLDLDGRVPEVRHQIDFRQVYQTILDQWMGCGPAASAILGRSFASLPLIRS